MTTNRTHLVLFLVVLALLSGTVAFWVHSASSRLAEIQSAGKGPGAAVASAADEGYCTGALKQILRRVLTSCGLIKGGSQRGCQPMQARSVAAMSGEDFNALFVPLSDRAARRRNSSSISSSAYPRAKPSRSTATATSPTSSA